MLTNSSWKISLFVLMTYAISLVEPMSIFEQSRSLSRSNEKQTGMEMKNIKSKSWNDLRHQLLKNHETIFEEGTLEEHQRKRRSVVVLKPTNSRKAQLLSCKLLNYNLAIMDDGKVIGVKNQSSPNVVLDLERYEGGLATIQNPKNKRYIAMNSNGTVYSTKTFCEDVLFRYLTGHFPYIQFSSYKYKHNGKAMFIGLRADGTTKKGKKLSSTHKSSQFLMVAKI
ncbi:fibroblast growth factor 1-like [Dendronephthya gigantea]|uniref:fibroblast growth factor 1-like n=1 Tax=Dendronephthya gigantea TaxID=151771 RepID=UPI00106B3ADC|nr:fibroblast growth factor 1-like [Dendronephthya gigantea]